MPKDIKLTNARFHSTDKAEPIHAWLTRQLPNIPHPEFRRPINYVKIAITTTAVLGLITFGTVAAPYLLPIIQNRNLWAAVSLIAVLLFTSGHMFNHIRKVPYVAADGKGGVSYFAGGFQNQFGLETQIVAALCKFFYFLFLLVSPFSLDTLAFAIYPSGDLSKGERGYAGRDRDPRGRERERGRKRA